MDDAVFSPGQKPFLDLVASVEDLAIFLLTPEGRIASWNAGAARITGYSAEEIVGEPLSRLYPEEANAAGEPAQQLKAAADQGTFAGEGWRLRKDGSRFWASAIATRLPAETGGPHGFLIITRDRPERLRIEEMLRQSEERFRILIEGVQEYAIFMLNSEGNIISWNSGAQRIKGYDASEIIGRHFSVFYPPEVIQAGKPEWELRTALERGFVEDEGWRLRKDGQQFWASVVITALRDNAGQHIGFAKVTRDLTDRRRRQEAIWEQAEAKLLESEERFARFTRFLPGLAWIKDLEGRYVYVNDAAAKVFDFPREQIYGRTDEDLFPPETAAQFRANDRRALLGETGVEAVEILTDSQGRVRHSVVSKFPILDAEGKRHLIGGIAIDITERVRAEESLRLADRRKDEFLATLSHELRNPLAPIKTGIHILRMKRSDAETTQVYEMLEHQLVRLVRLVDDLLEVSRISGGKIELRRELVELNSVIHRAIESSRPLIDGESHNLILRLPPHPLIVDADPIRLAQVISNLLDNAAKYTPQGGHIWVTARQEGDEAVVVVRDDGLGIPAEMVSQVFDMFAQVDRTLNRSQGGLGIGLALAKSLIEMHGGRIEAFSEGLDRGSKFAVRMPIHSRGRIARPASAPEEPPSVVQRPRILVIDDNRDAADSLGMVLRMMGADPKVVYDGATALEAAQSYRPSAVLLDLGMPGMDGYEVAARFRSTPEFRSLYLIALTGWGSEDDRRRSREAGFDDHWVKPVEPELLRQLLAGDAGSS